MTVRQLITAVCDYVCQTNDFEFDHDFIEYSKEDHSTSVRMYGRSLPETKLSGLLYRDIRQYIIIDICETKAPFSHSLIGPSQFKIWLHFPYRSYGVQIIVRRLDKISLEFFYVRSSVGSKNIVFDEDCLEQIIII